MMHKKNKYKAIGILGGMGPVASANLYHKLLSIAQDKYQAEQDSDYPQIILNSLSMQGFNETGFTDQNLVKKELIAGVKTLEAAGADFIIIACNTVHYFLHEMQKNVSIPILSIISETIKEVKKRKYRTVGILSSESTLKLGLYTQELSNENIDAVAATEREQKVLNQVILNVMAGHQGEADTKGIIKIVESMRKKGAEAIVLGCTEIPLVIGQDDIDTHLFNSSSIIAESALRFAGLVSSERKESGQVYVKKL